MAALKRDVHVATMTSAEQIVKILSPKPIAAARFRDVPPAFLYVAGHSLLKNNPRSISTAKPWNIRPTTFCPETRILAARYPGATEGANYGQDRVQ